MREITELVCALPWDKLKSSGFWDIVLKPGSKMAQLFDIIHRGQAPTQEAAAQLLYNSVTPQALGKLQRLKNKLKERLLEVISLLDFQQPGYTDRQKAHFECNKRWSTAMTLLSKKMNAVGIEQLEHMLRHTQHFEFTELSLNALYHLRLHFGTLLGDPKKYEHYRSLYKEYQAIWAMENEAEELYTQLISRFVSSRAPQSDVADKAEEYFRQIEPYMARSASFRLQLCGRLLQLMIFSSRNDYKTVADLCEQAIGFFRQKPYSSDLHRCRLFTTSWWSLAYNCAILAAGRQSSAKMVISTVRALSIGLRCRNCIFCWPCIRNTMMMPMMCVHMSCNRRPWPGSRYKYRKCGNSTRHTCTC